MSPDHAIPIQSVGFGWTPILLTIANLLLGGVMVAIIRSRPALKKIAADREANLLNERAEEMAGMRERIDRLEKLLTQKDKEHAAEKEADRKLFEAHLAHYRHRTNNLDGAFNALLLLLKQGVRVEEAVEAVEKMRSEQLTREAAEAATLRAAGVQLAATPKKAGE